MDEERRTVERFAWLPTRMDDGSWCWWSRYRAIEHYEGGYDSGFAGGAWIEMSRWRVSS